MEDDILKDYLYQKPEYYMGATYPDHYELLGQHRDSDVLTRSNFEVFYKQLESISPDTVFIHSANHWAVGWVESIMLTPDAPENQKIEAMAMLEAIEDYPVLDEGHYSEMEQEEANETWCNCYDDLDRIEYIRKFRDQFEFHDYAELRAVIRGEYFNGYASELIY